MEVYIFTREDLDRIVNEHGFLEKTMFLILFPAEERFDGYNSSDIQRFTDYWTALQVYDIDADELEEYGLTEDTYFAHYEFAVDTIKSACSKNYDIVCFDENGTNLSSACAAAILEYCYGNGISIFSDSRYTPNKLLYNKMLEALRKER